MAKQAAELEDHKKALALLEAQVKGMQGDRECKANASDVFNDLMNMGLVVKNAHGGIDPIPDAQEQQKLRDQIKEAAQAEAAAKLQAQQQVQEESGMDDD